ncbi:MAG: hydantoinase B/oxoprolinase family protein, partial [Phycisphaerae bacterium]
VAKDSLLSGPAGGAVGAARAARAAGFERAIGFDMGGTSTDVSRFDGRFERRGELHIEDRATGGSTRVLGDMIAIETVAAGGGSICDFDGAQPTVGPRSAGADPGPACYGRGGPLCITDCNLLLGRIDAARFPFPLDRPAAERRIDEQIARIAGAVARVYRREELAAGYVAIANAHMTTAIRQASVRRGYDPRAYPLVSFGGAAGQHACAVAGALGMRAIVIHPCASLLSAYGVGAAEIARFAACDIGARLDDATLERVRRESRALEASLRDVLRAEAPPGASLVCRRRLELRYVGQDEPLVIDEPADGEWRAAFEAAHERVYGFAHRGRAVEVRAVRCEVAAASAAPEQETLVLESERLTAPAARAGDEPADPAQRARVFLDSAWIDAVVSVRDALRTGSAIPGPALIVDANSTVVVEAGWCAEVRSTGALVLKHVDADATPAAETRPAPDVGASDPIELQLLRGALDSVAEEMGAALRRTALSTNVKERLDYSCAVYSAQAELVAHAAHIPVHIGAMEDCVRRLVADVGPERIRSGASFATNHPYRGGSHLPDVTVVTPVLDADGAPRFFVANRAHHAEIGGIAPGSMPAASRSLADEGVLLDALELVDGAGHFREAELHAALTRGPHPSRAPEQNIADLRAQLAANQAGVARLRALSHSRAAHTLQADLQQLLADAERRARTALRRLGAGARRFVDYLDDGTPITLRLTLADGTATFDFADTGGVLTGNLNATPAIVRSAVLYCVRCLAAEDLSLNAGVARAVRIVLPECLLNPPLHANPARCPAVAGGNVETSQRIVDVVLGAFGVVAASQGTMNNVSFGDATFGYYETLAGGGGAGPGFDGADAVHTHMTNTRLTDVEVLEERYPVRVRQLAIRRGSGGAGRWRGGDGLVREIEFLAPLRVSLLTQRRTIPPYGLAGGGAGRAGANWLRRAAGDLEPLPGNIAFDIQPGEALVIETPGGGGSGEIS